MRVSFTENKRYRAKPGESDDVVNRNGDSVYQTDAVFALSWLRAKVPLRRSYDETV
jgi:hypothetical protein